MMKQMMKKHISILRRMFALALAAVLLVPYIPKASAAVNNKIRVGIFYGNNALPTANLQNYTGSGYQLGYYDAKYNFIPVGYVANERITMCKDKNLYHSNGSFYETAAVSSYRLVGAYHLQVSGTYASFEEAKNAAKAYPYGFPAYVNGHYVVRFEFYSKVENAKADAGKYSDVKVVGGSSTCYTVVNTVTGDILFEFDNGNNSCLAVQPDITGEENPITWFKGYRYYGGFQYNRRNGNDITVVNVVDLDRYVAGVLPNEFVCSGGLESLKAGAVAVRTFACASTKHSSLGFDVCTTTDCQVYRGVYLGAESAKVMQAAEETTGECLFYNGSLAQTTFYAANGGATESAKNTWGNDYPYLIAQKDPYEYRISFNSKDWTYTVTPSQVRQMLQKAGYSCGQITSMEVTELSDVGNVNAVKITDVNGKVIRLTSDKVRLLQNISGITYFSRRFRILPVYGGEIPELPLINNPAEYPSDEDPIIPDLPTEPDVPDEPDEPVIATGPLTVVDKDSLGMHESVYVITSSGVSLVEKPVSILTSSGIEVVHPDAEEGEGAVEDEETAPPMMRSTRSGKLTGWVIYGCGYGHNVGLSQWGAYAMAELGYTYDEILAFYYPGTKLS